MGCPPRKILFFLQNTHHPKRENHRNQGQTARTGTELVQIVDKYGDMVMDCG